MLQWCLQIRVKYLIPLSISLFLTYWIFGITSHELIPQWHIPMPTTRFYPFQVKQISDDVMKLYLVGDDNHYYHFHFHLKRIPRLELLPEALPMHALALPSSIKNVKAFDVRIINTMQIIILLNENSTVFAIDDNFNVMWQSNVFIKTEGFGDLVDTGFVRFLDTCLSPEQCSAVLVGVSLRGSRVGNSTNRDHDHNSEGDRKHLSTVAFDAESGELIWRHLPYDYGRGLEDESERLAPSIRHHWKLKILRSHLRMEHIDERPWVTYLPFFLNLLPYSWVGPHDTEILQTSLRHHRVVPSPKEKEARSFLENGRANVIVVRHEKGLEVLDLFTGKPRSHLQLDGGVGKTFFRDASRLLLASLETSENENSATICSLRVIPRSAIGPTSTHAQLQWDDVCSPVGILGNSRPAHTNYREDNDKIVPPVVVDSYQTWPGFLSGLGLGFSYRNIKDIFTLVSDGTLSSYSTNGKSNWRVNVPVSWISISRDLASGDLIGGPVADRYKNLFVPTLYHLPASENGWGVDALVATGWNSIAVVDVKTGMVLTDHDLPCQPLYRPVVSEDHMVVVCDTMIIGFHLSVPFQIGTFLMAFVSFALVSVICVCCFDPNSLFWEMVD